MMIQKWNLKIEDYIKRNHLLDKRGKYLVALSGGADSVALLLTLHELGYQVEACHCNFQLRGSESERDELFCVQLCEKLSIPLHRIHFDTKLYAEVHKESIELAARNLRYRYFHQLKDDVEAVGICVAHHQDDTVETVLINLIRGTGIQGLTGISAKNGDVVRPLLCADRQEILGYLAEKGQGYVTDSTNLVDDVVRNKIRLNIIPMLKEINPAASKNIAQAAHHLEEANKMLESCISHAKSDEQGFIHLPIEDITHAASCEYALYAYLQPFGFKGKMIEDILTSIHSTGKMWASDTHRLVIDRNEIIVQKKEIESFHAMKIPETGCYVLPQPVNSVSISSANKHEKNHQASKIKLSQEERSKDFVPSKEKYLVTLDANKVVFPLTLRLVQNGDIFQPFGMKGKKLVSDYLTDRKKNLFEKQKQLVVTDAHGEIIWVVGERTSELCKIEESTETVLKIEFA